MLSLLIVGAGCSETPPPAATTNLALTREEQRLKLQLMNEDTHEVRRAFAWIAAGRAVQDPPRVPAAGLAWSDVPAAVLAACDDIEAAVMGSHVTDDEIRFTLRTVEDWPGELIVRRVSDERVYEAEATISLFPSNPARVERAQRLLDALEQHLRAFGRKRRFIDEPAN